MTDYVSIGINLKYLPSYLANMLTPLLKIQKKSAETEGRTEEKKKANETVALVSGTKSSTVMFLAALLFSGGTPMMTRTVSEEGGNDVFVPYRGRKLDGFRLRAQRRGEPCPGLEEGTLEERLDDVEEEEDIDFLKVLNVSPTGKATVDPDLLLWLERLKIFGEGATNGRPGDALVTAGGVDVLNDLRLGLVEGVSPRITPMLNRFDIHTVTLLMDANRPHVVRRPVTDTCTGGVYRLEDAATNRPFAIWKPSAEEDLFRSPEQRKRGPLREGLRVGDGALRELAAYVLDESGGEVSAGVPVTGLVSLEGCPGSLQRFRAHECCADDMGTLLFDTQNVHRIGILDLRILNLDRHGGNMLIDESHTLIPIDHGLSLPPIRNVGEAEFGWLHWRQAKMPFDADTLRFIRELSPEADADRLREIGLAESSVLTNYVCTVALRWFAERGSTLHEIGTLFSRNGVAGNRSVLERAVAVVLSEDGDVLSPKEFSRRVVEEMETIRKDVWKLGMDTASLWRRNPPPMPLESE